MGKLVTLLLVSVVGVLALVIYVQLDRPVTRVLVGGPLEDAERQEIRDVVSHTIDGGLLSADLAALRAAIMDLSWPRAVAVRRGWPASLLIDVDKPAVVARWQDAFLSSDGQIVRLPGDRADLPVFDCSLSEPRMAMEIFHSLSEACATHGLVVTRVEENELGEWVLTLVQQHSVGAPSTEAAPSTDTAEALVVVLGADHVAERLDRFLLVYEKAIHARHAEVARVDARYDNGVAVSWRAGAAFVATAGAR
jgi:cell division protein FtsQ